MIRFSLLLLLSLTVHGDDKTNLKELNSLFQDPGLEKMKRCSGIHGDLSRGCFDCYPCEDERLRKYKQKPKKLNLVSNSCDTTTTVCCVEQKLFVTRKDRASSSNVLCAGTVVHETSFAVLTSASCVHGYTASELSVSFSRKQSKEFDVAVLIVHDLYTSSRPHVHDIALLQMDMSGGKLPRWANSVCLPEFAVMHATTCITMSDTDCLINTVVPMEENCKTSGVLVNENQLCATTPIGDYEPEHGAALICSDSLRLGTDNYILYGIALKTNGSVTTYTDVYKYQTWIDTIMP